MDSSSSVLLPPLTAAQKRRIQQSPAHRRLRHLVYSSLALAFLGAATDLTCLVLGAVWARGILQQHRWFIFHYVVAATFAALWLVYSAFFWLHVKRGYFPDQLRIDIGWITMSALLSACFQGYLYYKFRTYGLAEEFDLTCQTDCPTRLAFVRLSPLVTALTSTTLALAQLGLCLLVCRSPLVRAPLDAHGMPKAQDPETGLPLPVGPDGRPVLPEWLRPPRAGPGTTSGTPRGMAGGDRGKKLAGRQTPVPAAPQSTQSTPPPAYDPHYEDSSDESTDGSAEAADAGLLDEKPVTSRLNELDRRSSRRSRRTERRS